MTGLCFALAAPGQDKHPEAGEVVVTKGNHKILKAWDEMHGAEEVESWLQSTEEIKCLSLRCLFDPLIDFKISVDAVIS